MARMSVTDDEVNAEFPLLPVERMGETGMVKVKYLFEITSAIEKVSRKGDPMLKIVCSTDNLVSGERVDIDDYFSYKKKAIYKLKELLGILKVKAPFDTDDIMGKFIWATIKHETLKMEATEDRPAREITSEKIDTYLRMATPEEVADYMRDRADIPGKDPGNNAGAIAKEEF